jgi:hypothetical protein
MTYGRPHKRQKESYYEVTANTIKGGKGHAASSGGQIGHLESHFSGLSATNKCRDRSAYCLI